VLACVAIAGGIQGIVKAVVRKRLKFVLTSVYVSFFGFILPLVTNRKIKPAEVQTGVKQSGNLDIPYGVAILAGVCAAGGILWLL
jgi:hypothetical protein